MTTDRPVRHRCELVARLDARGRPGLKVRVLDLSEAGAFIEEGDGLEELQVGDSFQLTIALPGGAHWQASAVVSRLGTSRRDLKHPTVAHVTVSATGFGVEFAAMEDDALEQLRGFLELLDER
ncbi:MAG: PilZ domain-containing protein [Myxococcaceae bacterium]|nr:PilZ domain-containing protein [Myxococcaceae bacterium]